MMDPNAGIGLSALHGSGWLGKAEVGHGTRKRII